MFSWSRQRTHTGWPFWLLIVAWVGANSPQSAVHGVLDWVGEARHFSHQQRLQTQITVLLSGGRTPATPVAMQDEATKPLNQPALVESGCTKIHLAGPETNALRPPFLKAVKPWTRLFQVADAIRDQPPHEPPRVRPIV